MKAKMYVGCISGREQYEAFDSDTIPTPEKFPQYIYVIGEFRTRRGQKWAAKYGHMNPHFQHVNDAERFAAQMVREGTDKFYLP